MNVNDCSRSGLAKSVAICALSTLLLFSEFYSNSLRVADQEWFIFQNHDMESNVVARLVKSRQDGIFSAGGLPGLGSLDATPVFYSDRPFDAQYSAYVNGLTFGAYTPYESQSGGQAILFSLLDRFIPLASQTKLQFFYMLTALLSALALALVVLWFFREFGLCAAMFALASMALSQWLVVFGRNLWWSLWAFYLPMVAVMYFLQKKPPAHRYLVKFGALIFLSVFVKCLINGYEYITTTLIMMTAPFLYYSILHRSTIRGFVKGTLVAISSSGLAVFFSFAILCLQVASVEGRLLAGVAHIVDAFGRRTYPEPYVFGVEHGENLESNPNPTHVVLKYVVGEDAGVTRGTFIDFNNYLKSRWYVSGPLQMIRSVSKTHVSNLLFKVRYLSLIVLFLLASAFVLWRNRGPDEGRRRNSMALILTTWVSMFAPLSWFYIFNQHSYIHTQMNFIVWQMPFTIFGFAVCGLAAQVVVRDLRLPKLSLARRR